MTLMPIKEDVPIRLPWRLTCKLAVLAYLNNISFDQIVEMAIQRDILS